MEISEIKEMLRDSHTKTLGSEMKALLLLLKHPLLTWNDLLDTYSFTSGINTETVSLIFHSRLKIPINNSSGRTIICDRDFWTFQLEKANVKLTAFVKDFKP